VAGFRSLLAFPELREVYRSESLFPVFANRVMNASRPEFESFVQWLDLPASETDPLVPHARSGGRRETAMFEVFSSGADSDAVPSSSGARCSMARGVPAVRRSGVSAAAVRPRRRRVDAGRSGTREPGTPHFTDCLTDDAGFLARQDVALHLTPHGPLRFPPAERLPSRDDHPPIASRSA
jgi:hypothetical protein